MSTTPKSARGVAEIALADAPRFGCVHIPVANTTASSDPPIHVAQMPCERRARVDGQHADGIDRQHRYRFDVPFFCLASG
jgi:hypothetical protein